MRISIEFVRKVLATLCVIPKDKDSQRFNIYSVIQTSKTQSTCQKKLHLLLAERLVGWPLLFSILRYSVANLEVLPPPDCTI